LGGNAAIGPHLPQLALDDGEVHIWRLQPESAADLSRYSQLLSHEEQDRASRFHHPHLTRNFVVDHARLRLILGTYTRSSPADLVFTANKFGKPELANPASSFRFNLSHTEGISLLAVCRDSPVGIDVEAARPMNDWRNVADCHFAPQELTALLDTPGFDRQNAFFRCWTRKEAFLKAHGRGLSIALDSFAVSVANEDFPQLLECAWDRNEIERWSLFSLDLGPQFIGALAILRSEWKIRSFDWSTAAPIDFGA